MSEEQNRKVVQELFESFGRGDVPAMLAALSEDVSWRLDGPPGVPFFGEFKGREGVTEFLGKLGSNVEMQRFEPREFITSGERVVVLGGEGGRVISTGRVFDNEWALVFTVREGKITSFRSYEDSGAVAAAFVPEG